MWSHEQPGSSSRSPPWPGWSTGCTPLSSRALRSTGSRTDARCFRGLVGATTGTLTWRQRCVTTTLLLQGSWCKDAQSKLRSSSVAAAKASLRKLSGERNQNVMLLSKVKPRTPQGLSTESHQYRSEATNSTMPYGKHANHGHFTHNIHITGPDWAQPLSMGNMSTGDKSLQTGIRLGIVKPPGLSPRLGHIRPEPTQILTVFQDKAQTLDDSLKPGLGSQCQLYETE